MAIVALLRIAVLSSLTLLEAHLASIIDAERFRLWAFGDDDPKIGQGYVNAEVAKHIDEVQIFELNKNLQAAITSENKEEVQKVAQQIEQKGQLMGPRAAKKTMLARQVL